MVTNELGGSSTLCAAAKRYEWTGFLKTGHASGTQAAWVGMKVYQPTMASANYVGSVQQVGGYRSDASFVPFNDVTPKIYLNYWVAEYRNPDVGASVRKSGVATGETYGQVIRYSDEYSVPHGRWLTYQAIANYYAAGGDSGSPIFFPVYYQYVVFYGIHWGYKPATGETIFSPTTGIYADVHAVPITV